MHECHSKMVSFYIKTSHSGFFEVYLAYNEVIHTKILKPSLLVATINQSGAMLFSIGDHDFPCISILCCF